VDRALLSRVLLRLVPRPRDIGEASVGAIVGLLVLVGTRLAIARATLPTATALDCWRTQYSELETWTMVALVAGLILRWAGDGRLRGALRLVYHLFIAALLCLSLMELVFFHVTGSRADFDVLAYFLHETRQVMPVFLSELKAWHVGALLAAIVVSLAPLRVRLSRPGRPAWGLLFALGLVLPTVVLEAGGRERPERSLRELQPAFIESLWFDGIERIGDATIAPPPGALDKLVVERSSDQPPPNIVLILLESIGTRNTTLGDPTLPTTPNLAALAERGLLVQDAWAVVPHTSKALVATLCGTWPKLVSDIREAQLGGLTNRCLPELLGTLGYRTAFFQTARESFEYRTELTHRMGFDFFRARDQVRRSGFDKVNYFGIEDRAMIEPGLKWTDAGGDQPFFATYLTLTSHHDYGVPADFATIDFPGVDERRAEHLNAVRYVDQFVAELIAAYEEAGHGDDTLFIILGDHGEAFGEHGRSQHDLVIWEEGLRIPMVLYGPGVLGERSGVIEGPRQQIDLLPTVIELAGARITQGQPLGLSLLGPVSEEREILHSCWRSHRCLASRSGDRKFIDHYRQRPAQLFDLATDPEERVDLAAEADAEEIAALRSRLRTWRAEVNGLYEAGHEQALAERQWPDTSSPAIASWMGKIDLIGCDPVRAEVSPGEAAWFRCRWRANEPLTVAWRLEARLEGGFAPQNKEITPFDGLLPTFTWPAGWIVEDEFLFHVPATARPGPARLSLGWGRYGAGPVPVDGGGERVPATDFEIRQRDGYRGASVTDRHEQDDDVPR